MIAPKSGQSPMCSFPPLPPLEHHVEDGVLLTSAVVGVEEEEEEVVEESYTWDFAPTWELSCVRMMLCSMTGHAWS